MAEPRYNMNPDAGGIKADGDKEIFHLLDDRLLAGVRRVLAKGAVKYGDWNWQKGMPYSRSYNALRRHLAAFWAKDDIDAESGEHHLDHVIANAIFLRYFAARYPELDDRIDLFPAEVEPPKVPIKPLATGEVPPSSTWDDITLATMPPLPAEAA